MKKIAFSCPFNIGSDRLLQILTKQSPNNDGIWDDLKGVSNVYDADWIVASENLDPQLDIDRINQDKVILCGREPPWICTADWSKHLTSYKFASILGNSYLLAGWSFPATYKEMKNLQWERREKKVCVITSNKRMCPGHEYRLNFIRNFCNKYPNVLDVYGTGMSQEGLGSHYKGVSVFGDAKKLEWLLQYDYALCIENGQLDGFFTEKLTDSFMAHTVPIYWGAPDVQEYFSGNSFHHLDITDPEAPHKLEEILRIPVSSTTREAVSDSREKIMNQYNWWPSIKRIIDTGRVLP